MIDDDRRKAMRDALDEFDKYMEEVENHIQEAVKESIGRLQSHPFVTGFSFKLGPGGKPSVQVFGDKLVNDEGYRSPLSEQIVDEKNGKLRLMMDMPGVEKSDIRVDATNDSAVVVAANGARKYKAEIHLRSEVDTDSGRAEYRNGVLEISFSLKDKTNKHFRKVDVV